MPNKTQNLNQNSGQNQSPKKESCSLITVKIFLVVLIFIALGTIIIGGGYIIVEYYKNRENRITKPIIQPIISEVVDFKVKGYSQTFSYESASMAMDCGFVDGKIASGKFQSKELIVFLPNHTTEKYPKKDEIIKIFITNEKAILRNKFDEVYKREFPYYCLEDKDMDDGKKNNYAFQEIFAFKMPSEIDQSDTSDWQTYRNEEFGFEVKYPNSWIIEKGVNNIIRISDFDDLVSGIGEGGQGFPSSVFRITETKSEKSISLSDIIEALNKLPQDKCKLDIERVKIGNYSAIKYVNCSMGNPRVIEWVVDKYIYKVEIFNRDQIINQILSTFKFID